MSVTLERTDDGTVATLRFVGEHPLNVLDAETLEALLDRVREVAADRAVRVLVLTGRDDVFSGGADLTHLAALDDDAYRHYLATEYTLFAELEDLPLVTVAVVAGACVGNGAEMALCCDFRICDPAARIGLPEMRVGFVSPAQRLARLVGMGRAKEILYGGRLLPAAEALELGLVTAVAEDLAAETARATARYAAFAPYALPFTKAGVHRAYGVDGVGARPFDAHEQRAAFATFRGPDFVEGSDAALAGRRPAFTSRRPATTDLGGTP
ncbi:enoyl-CoA hydratase/isomerase family protein [Actinomycetospora sp. TBRC 11914]|uniref:enoyl-CoA hydratase/isomerase family protein n=1 Tax=Actinomycetospora sp. TBRC 11914 TaxID=2729387 RepID=UPI00145E2DF6|nr:enoyl-CoA hydratase/isomerase family protein [Actinomycetospora sp. TBRC 11914]NMO92724.1 enoyl-CoA hydratase/isomerase family protein [Actinomycetospora sp. TBRC 11914]